MDANTNTNTDSLVIVWCWESRIGLRLIAVIDLLDVQRASPRIAKVETVFSPSTQVFVSRRNDSGVIQGERITVSKAL